MRSVERLQKAPWLDGTDANPNGEAARTGVPVVPFPDWLRCTACDELAPSTSSTFTFVNDNPYRPHEARFVHADCPRARNKRPLAVAARFVLAAWPGTSTTSRSATSSIRGCPAPRWSGRGCGCRTAARTSAPTSRSGA